MDTTCVSLLLIGSAGLLVSGYQVTELDTGLGRVRGYTEKVLGIRMVKSFLGIPFGKAPVGDLRFQRPLPYGEWSDTWNATAFPKACPQIMDTSLGGYEGVTMWNPNTEISEDCLYLNVWTPANVSAVRHVLVWIYGGGFYSGTSTLDWYDGRILAAQGDVVVVSMQYRVGVIGFLSLGNEKAPGNAGLLDQHLALKWIHDNIADYGGDPDRITLFGESSGAASVSFHLMSPMSRGLFQRVILQSSSSLAPWAIDPQPTTQEKSLAIAKAVGCSASSVSNVLDCLLTIPHAKLTDTMWALADTDQSVLQTPITPTVDGYFFPKHPTELLAEGDVTKTSVLLGVNHDEGAYYLPFFLPSLFNHTWQSVNSQEKYLRAIKNLLNIQETSVSDVVAFEYQQPYHYGDKHNYTNMLSNVLGDYVFICPVINFAKAYAELNEDVYFYRFNHITSASPWPTWMGVLHGYEIDTVFGKPLNQTLAYTAAEKELSKRIIAHWTNFAATGNPVKAADGSSMGFDWPAYTLDRRSVMILNTTHPPHVRNGLRDRKCSFWDQLYPKLKTGQGNPCNEGGMMTAQTTTVATMIVCMVALRHVPFLPLSITSFL